MGDDALRPGISVVPEFVDGEQPSAAKLNSIGVQVERAALSLERAVGDIHGTSWPYMSPTAVNPDTRLSMAWGRHLNQGVPVAGAEERALDIANIARLIGPSSNLNARMISKKTTVVDNVPGGVHEFQLKYNPYGINGSDPPIITDDDGAFANDVGDGGDLTSDGDYYISGDGKVYTARATRNDGTVTTIEYSVWPRRWRGGMNHTWARHNVIPDPNQITSGGAGANQTGGLQFGAKDGQGRYPITFPNQTHAQATHRNSANSALSDVDINFNQPYELPKVLTDNLNPGDGIPDGYLYLRNMTTNKTYEDGQYYYNGVDALLVGNVDLDAAIASNHNMVIMTVGCDITTSIDDLREKTWNHKHDRSYGEPFISISGVVGFTELATEKGRYVPSQIPGNFAPQYLHRDGHINNAQDPNINEHNLMRGNLWMGGKDNQGTGPYYRASDNDGSYNVLFDSATCSIGRTSTFPKTLSIRNSHQGGAGADYDNGGIIIETSSSSVGGDIFLATNGSNDIRLNAAGETRITDGLFRCEVNAQFDGTFVDVDGYLAVDGAIRANAGFRGDKGGDSNTIKAYAFLTLLWSPPPVSSHAEYANLLGILDSVSIYGLSVMINESGSDHWAPPGEQTPGSENVAYWAYWRDTGPRLLIENVGLNPASLYTIRTVVWYR